MRYRLRCDLAFINKDTANLAFNYLKKKLADVSPIVSIEAITSPEMVGSEVSEGKFLQLELCRHDEGGSCELLEEVK